MDGLQSSTEFEMQIGSVCLVLLQEGALHEFIWNFIWGVFNGCCTFEAHLAPQSIGSTINDSHITTQLLGAPLPVFTRRLSIR